MHGKTTLIVGGTGDTGKRLANALGENREIIITTRMIRPEITKLFPATVQFVEADPVSKPNEFCEFIQKFTQQQPFDEVYNLLGAWLRNPYQVVYEGCRNILDALKFQKHQAKFIFCSATTVYGDRPGEKLNETSDLTPNTEIGKIQLQTEALLVDSPHVIPVILRTPHIYGPGRERTFELMKQGNFIIVGDGTNPMHHIYIKDFIKALVAVAETHFTQPEIFNIVDDIPLPYRDYCDFISDYCEQPRLPCYSYKEIIESGILTKILGPHFQNTAAVEELYKYMVSHAVIDNTKMKNLVQLDYPTFYDGLTEMLQ